MPTHRLLADEQFPDRVTDRLRLCGHDVARVRDFDLIKSGDAREDDSVLLASLRGTLVRVPKKLPAHHLKQQAKKRVRKRRRA
jgi:hypothetical protein